MKEQQHISPICLVILRESNAFLANSIDFLFLNFCQQLYLTRWWWIWIWFVRILVISREENILFKLALVYEMLNDLCGFLLCYLIYVLQEFNNTLIVENLEYLRRVLFDAFNEHSLDLTIVVAELDVFLNERVIKVVLVLHCLVKHVLDVKLNLFLHFVLNEELRIVLHCFCLLTHWFE